MYNHSDFGKSFKIVITEEPDKEIKDKFFNDLSLIDKQLIDRSSDTKYIIFDGGSNRGDYS